MSETVYLDWGTTNFRAHLVGDDGTIIESIRTSQGVGKIDGGFEDVLRANLEAWLREFEVARICCAGMIGGDLGWRDVRMVACPANIQDLADNIVTLHAPGVPLVSIVPGICDFDHADCMSMMRGEEVLLFGSLARQSANRGHFCFPGTHSKWVVAEHGAVRSIQTCMTGELFEMLRTGGVLSRSLAGWSGEISERDFLRGVSVASGIRNPLQSAFSVRAMHLHGTLPTVEARCSYLSGLLIGSEVAGFASEWRKGCDALTIVGESRLAVLYERVCHTFGFDTVLMDAKECFVAGGIAILERSGLHADLSNRASA